MAKDGACADDACVEDCDAEESGDGQGKDQDGGRGNLLRPYRQSTGQAWTDGGEGRASASTSDLACASACVSGQPWMEGHGHEYCRDLYHLSVDRDKASACAYDCACGV